LPPPAGFNLTVMEDGSSMRGRRLPAGAPLLALGVLCAALAAALAAAALAPGAGGPGRAELDPVSAPRQPIERSAAADPRDPELRAFSRGFLLAGRPGQALEFAVRLRGHESDAPLVAELRRIRRADPRHPGTELGGELEARVRRDPAGRDRLRFALRDLSPLPGPHRLRIRVAKGEAIAATRIDVLPQGRLPIAAEPEGSTGSPKQRRSEAVPVRQRVQRATEVDQTLGFDPGSQASSAVAVETDDPSRAIAAANDAGSSPVAKISSDSLRLGSITTARLPTTTELPDGSAASIGACCDPATAADADGNLWMAATSTEGNGRILLARAGVGNDSFGSTAAGLPIAPGTSSQQKPALAVDDEWIAAAWIETGSGVQNVVVSRCSLTGGVSQCDDPAAWSAPAPVTETSGLYSMPDLGFAPNGDLHAVWWDAGDDNAIEIARCRDGEDCSSPAVWNERSTVDALDDFDDDGDGDDDPLPIFCPIIAAPGGLVNPSPSVEVGPDGTVHVAFSDLRDNPDPGSPSRCTATGSDKTWESFVASGGDPNDFPDPNDGVRLSADDELDVNDHFLPALSADPSTGEVEAGFYTTASDPSGQFTRRVYVASSDLGLSFSDPEPTADADSRFAGTHSDGIDYGDRQGADSAEGTFRPAWTDARAIQARDPELYALAPQVETTIASGPTGTVAEAKSTFTFSSPAPRTDCSIDGQPFTNCSSPFTAGPLPNGPHTLRVRSTDSVGNLVDLSDAVRSWTISDLDPPETTITNPPKPKVHKKRPVIDFVADEEEAKFSCRYDREPWERCKPPKRGKVSLGRHRFQVRATDVGGNPDPTAATVKFRRVEKKRRKGR
jgi:hypothetical protein